MSTRATPQLIEERRRDAKHDYEVLLAEMAERFAVSMNERYPGYSLGQKDEARLRRQLDARLRAVAQ